MKQAAAIKRASQQARNAMYQLDQQGVAELLLIYEQAAAEVRARLNHFPDAGNMVPTHQLQALLHQIEAVLDDLSIQRTQVIDGLIEQAATLGVRPFTAPGVLAVGGNQAVLDSAAASRIHEAAVRFVMEFTQADGLTLSDRLWRLDRGAKEALTRAIGMAVVQGQSAAQAAQQFLIHGEAIPADVAARVAGGRLPALAGAVDLLTNPSNGGYAQAERVMRTEINRAHGEAFMAAGEGTPGFAGWRYLLSPRHPAPDICDLLSSQNLHGLGAGVYPTREATPWPAHPNTLSFVEMVFVDEVNDQDKAGKETSLQALQRLSPEIRAGALGQTKAAYFDQGLLRTGMIRAPLYAVEQRLDRQGREPGARHAMPAHPDALPQFAAAVIPLRKLAGYALNPNHETGGNKARVFASALGYTQNDAGLLASALRAGLPQAAAMVKESTPWGQRYEVDIPVTGPKGSATVRTAWIVDAGTSAPPRLTSAYIKKK